MSTPLNTASSTTSSTVERAMTKPASTDVDLSGPYLVDPVQEETVPAVGRVGDVQCVESVDSPFPWEELRTLPTRQLRQLCNTTFKAMDCDFPPAEISAQYAALTDELEDRETLARQQAVIESGGGSGGESSGPREPTVAFRDNPMARRFELFVGGDLAGYVSYLIQGGQVTLLETAVTLELFLPGDEIEEILLRRTFLNAHRRRLAVKTHCGRVRAFLTAYPQYRYLVPATAQRAVVRINGPVSSSASSSSTA